MARITLTIGNKKRDLLHFDTELFYPYPRDKMFLSHFDKTLTDLGNPFKSMSKWKARSFLDRDPIIQNFGSYHKHNAWKRGLLEGYDRPRDILYSYRLSKFYEPFDGLMNIVFESTDHDDFFYHWFKDCDIQHGELNFYSEMDSEQPFHKIEFWDAWITQIEEHHSAYSYLPMYICCTISAATLRYNKSVVFQKNWYITEINSKPEPYMPNESPQIISIDWVDKNKNRMNETEIETGKAWFLIKTKGYKQGDILCVVLESDEGFASGKQEITIQGIVDSNLTVFTQPTHAQDIEINK